MIGALAVLLAFQLLGEMIVTALSLPIPGPVIGMLLLFLALWLRGSAPLPLRETAQGLLGQLSLLFVPAGSGVLAYLSLIRGQVGAIAIALIGSTVIAMSVTALTMHLFVRRTPSLKSVERKP